MSFTVAIVGRPNVGKSTLFNRLVGRRHALVDDTPGLTRDRREGEGRIADLHFRVFDTAGLEDVADDSLEARMRAQTEQALVEADVALLLIDARAGVTPLDRHFAAWLRRQGRRLILVANKCEGRAAEVGLYEAFDLGLGTPLALSAEHGEGLADLYEALRPFETEASPSDGDEASVGGLPARLHLAIVGRPNVGKSTLANRLIGAERLLTGPEAGITRDSISVDWQHEGRPIRLVDTAGLRRKARVNDRLERLSAADSLRAVGLAHVVLLLVDPRDGMEKQDLTIARTVIEEGRALVIAANKWDVTDDKQAAMTRLRERLEISMAQARGVAVVPVSARTGHGLDAMMAAILKAEEIWNRRFATGPLNRWLAATAERHPPPLAAGRRIRLRYITQVKARPPTFAIWVSRPKDLPDSYVGYLINALRRDFDLPGTPIRIHLRKGRNPYA